MDKKIIKKIDNKNTYYLATHIFDGWGRSAPP